MRHTTWTERDLTVLRAYYPIGGARTVKDVLGDRFSLDAIRIKAAREKVTTRWTDCDLVVLRNNYPRGGAKAVKNILGDKFKKKAIWIKASLMGIKYLGRGGKVVKTNHPGNGKKDTSKKPIKELTYRGLQVSSEAARAFLNLVKENRINGEYYPHNQLEFMDMLVFDLVELAQDKSRWNRAHYNLIKLRVLLERHRGSDCIIEDLLDKISFTVGAVEAVYKKENNYNLNKEEVE